MRPEEVPPAEAAGYELLEHTADVGIRSWGATTAEAFERAAHGLLDVAGVRGAGPGERRRIALAAPDDAALLVDFLNELLFLIDSEDVAVAAVEVGRASGGTLEADVTVVPLGRRPEGVTVKAATYHQLEVRRGPDGRVETRVYVDV